MRPKGKESEPPSRRIKCSGCPTLGAFLFLRLGWETTNPKPLSEQKLLVAQLLDRVAQLGGPLELEFLGRLAHLGLQFGDEGVQLASW